MLSLSGDGDSSAAGQTFTVIIENWGDEGTLIKEAFLGRPNGDDGNLHVVEGGKFAIRRKIIGRADETDAVDPMICPH